MTPRLRVGIAFGLSIIVAVTLQIVNGGLAAGLFGLLVLMVFPLTQGTTTIPQADPALQPMERAHIAMLIAGYFLMMLVTARSSLQLQDTLAFLNLPLQMVMWLLAIGLTWAGLGAVRLRTVKVSRVGWVVLGITGIALMPRIIALGTALRYLPDEWIFIVGIQSIDPAETALLTLVGFFATSTWVFTVTQAVVSHIVGGGVFGLRLTSAVVGTLTVAAVGWFAYEVERSHKSQSSPALPTAIVAAMLMAAFPMHINFSRFALYNIVDPLFGVLAVACVLAGLRRGNRTLFVSAGICLGLTAYFYEAGRFMFPAVFGGWFVLLIVRYRRVAFRGLLLTVVAALIVGLPPWIITLQAGDAAPSRLQNSLNEDATVISQDYLNALGESLLMVTTTPDSEFYPYYGTSQGIVPLVALPFVVLGVALALARPFAPGNALLLLWSAATLAGASLLSFQATPRYVILTPILVLYAAQGLLVAVTVLPTVRLQRGVSLALLGAAVIVGPTHYLLSTVPQMNERRDVRVASFGFYDFEDLLFRLEPLPPGTQVVVIADQHPNLVSEADAKRMAAYFNPAVEVVRLDTNEAALDALPPHPRRTFFIEASDVEIVGRLRTRYTLSQPMFSPADHAAEIGLVRLDVLPSDGQDTALVLPLHSEVDDAPE